ncbi:MAG: ATP-binding protein [Chloroflexi bacterium]|nr:ATP-binding protein [Chloroflexota bacterium]
MYTKPIDEITFSDIEEFVLGNNRESIVLDYKGDWPSDLAQVIAAMANTQGGVILIGVTEDNKTGLPQDILGVESARGADSLRQRVVSTAYKGVYPPVMPQVGVCSLDQDPDRAVVIVRVAPSVHTPHAVDSRRRIYVRVDSQTEPHSLATLDELEWLWDRRRQAEERRDALIEAAKERAAWILKHPTDTNEPSLLRAWVASHFYSGEDALPLNVVKELVQTRRVQSDVRGMWSFPNFAYTKRSVPLGYCVYSIEDRRAEYDELGTSGLLFSEMRLDEVNEQTGWKQLHVGLILSQIDGLLKFANLAYKQGQLWGLLQVHASLHRVKGIILYAVVDRLDRHNQELVRSPNKTILVLNETIDKEALEKTRPKFVKQAAKSILWAFGYGWDEEEFEQWYSSRILR